MLKFYIPSRFLLNVRLSSGTWLFKILDFSVTILLLKSLHFDTWHVLNDLFGWFFRTQACFIHTNDRFVSQKWCIERAKIDIRITRNYRSFFLDCCPSHRAQRLEILMTNSILGPLLTIRDSVTMLCGLPLALVLRRPKQSLRTGCFALSKLVTKFAVKILRHYNFLPNWGCRFDSRLGFLLFIHFQILYVCLYFGLGVWSEKRPSTYPVTSLRFTFPGTIQHYWQIFNDNNFYI